MYSGAERPDTELASITGAFTQVDGEQINSVLIGIDDLLCPGPDTRSPGLPDNACGNNTLVVPGTYRLRVVVQTTNKVTLGSPVSHNSWRRSKPFVTAPVKVEAGTIYRLIPVFTGAGFTAHLVPACRSTNHEKSVPKVHFGGECI
jgi:hypothetical protein